MDILTDQFSHEPPVYAKSQAASSPPPQRQGTSSIPQTPDYSSRPPPMVPGSSQINGSILAHSPSAKPTLPPRPTPNPDPPSRPVTQSPPPPIPRYSHPPNQNVRDDYECLPSSPHCNRFQAYHPPRSAASSAFPQDLPLYSTPSTHIQSPRHTRGSSVTYLSSPSRQAPSHLDTNPEPVPYPSQRWSIPPGNMPTHPPGPPEVPVPHYQPTPFQAPSSVPPPPTQPAIPTLPRNFLDADDDDIQKIATSPTNPPPRPPNPEILRLHAQLQAKFTSELATLDQALATDVQRLRTAQSDLLAGEPAIRDEMARLEAVRDVCRVVAGRFRTTVDNAVSNLIELRRKGDPEVDELICSTTIVYNQYVFWEHHGDFVLNTP